ncbi:hypothetical protein VPH35_106754 [Triticum aestivum]
MSGLRLLTYRAFSNTLQFLRCSLFSLVALRATGAEEKIEQSFVCSHLKVVNIECRKVDEGVHKILKFLSKCGILRDQISITHRFSFQKPMRPLPRSTTEPGGLSSFHP